MKSKVKHIIIILAILSFFLFNYKYKLFPVNFNRVPETEEKCFEIMTFNMAANDSVSLSQDVLEKLIIVINREKPDILCFQELAPENLNKIKSRIVNLYDSCGFIEDKLWRLSIFTHYPIRNSKIYEVNEMVDTLGFNDLLKQSFGRVPVRLPVISADIMVSPDKWVTVFNGHLRSSAYSTARRSMDTEAHWIDGIPLYYTNFTIGKRIRDYEARNIKSFLEKYHSTGHPVILAGDLNDWCGSYCVNKLMELDLKDAWWEGGSGFGWTYFGWHLRLRLDHILYGDEFELIDVKVVDSDLSDHKPLVAKFTL